MMHNVLNEKVSPAVPEPSPAAAHKIEIAQQAIDISLRRRGRIQPFPTIEARKTALLVVDMQTGFVAPGAVAEIAAARKIVPHINRLADGLRRAGGTVVWIISTYGPGAERDWTTFFNYIITGEAADQFRLAFAEGRAEHSLWHELDRRPADPVISKNRLTPFVDPARKLELLLRESGIDMVLVPLRLTISSVPIKRCGRRAMAAGVTSRLWEIGDIVDVLERGRQSKVDHGEAV